MTLPTPAFHTGATHVESYGSGADMGTVTSRHRENILKGTGTVAFPNGATGPGYTKGPPTMLGDIGLIFTDRDKGRRSAGYVYTGASTTDGTPKPVRRAVYSYPWNREYPNVPGTRYCVSGQTIHQSCNFEVLQTFVNRDMTSEWGVFKNLHYGQRLHAPHCTALGDSGGAVYSRRPYDGGVDAIGIHSAGASTVHDGVKICHNWYTDIHRTFDAWGGSLITAR